MTPLKPDPCAITLRWTGRPVPIVGDWLKAKRTAYLIIAAKTLSGVFAPVVLLRIKALRFAIADIPDDAVVHAFTWDPRGKKKTRLQPRA